MKPIELELLTYGEIRKQLYNRFKDEFWVNGMTFDSTLVHELSDDSKSDSYFRHAMSGYELAYETGGRATTFYRAMIETLDLLHKIAHHDDGQTYRPYSIDTGPRIFLWLTYAREGRNVELIAMYVGIEKVFEYRLPAETHIGRAKVISRFMASEYLNRLALQAVTPEDFTK